MNADSTRIILRPAATDDAKAVTGLLEQLGYPNDVAHVGRRIAEMPGPDDAIFVAELDGRAVGLACLHRIPLFHTSGALARITAFVVDRDVHRRGVGRALLEKVDAWGREKNCARIEVTSGSHRAVAHAFYQAYGYRLDHGRFIRQLS